MTKTNRLLQQLINIHHTVRVLCVHNVHYTNNFCQYYALYKILHVLVLVLKMYSSELICTKDLLR